MDDRGRARTREKEKESVLLYREVDLIKVHWFFSSIDSRHSFHPNYNFIKNWQITSAFLVSSSSNIYGAFNECV